MHALRAVKELERELSHMVREDAEGQEMSLVMNDDPAGSLAARWYGRMFWER